MPDSIPQDAPDFSKRYWLFLFMFNEPAGGMNDFYGSFDTIEDAENLEFTHVNFRNAGMIFDIETRQIVSDYGPHPIIANVDWWIRR